MSVKKRVIPLIVTVGLVLVGTACNPTSTLAPTLLPTSSPSTKVPTPTCPPDPSKYGFESADVFWVPQTFTDSQAVIAVTRSEPEKAKFGCHSLELTVDLVGGHENKSKGEAYIDMRFYPPTAIEVPVNLEGVPITVWVYATEHAAGDPEKPNGIQVFVKDQDWKAEYGTWFNLLGNTDKWVPVQLTPSRIVPSNGFMDPGFDPTKIIAVGVKIGAGGSSTATYSGPIYVDAVDW